MQWTTSCAWDNVHKMDSEAQKHTSIYCHAQSALQQLDIDSDYMETLHNITNDDLNVMGGITKENRFGQCSDAIPWFWQIGEPVGSSGPQMQEYKWQSILVSIPPDPWLVYRVSWLRAKAHLARW